MSVAVGMDKKDFNSSWNGQVRVRLRRLSSSMAKVAVFHGITIKLRELKIARLVLFYSLCLSISPVVALFSSHILLGSLYKISNMYILEVEVELDLQPAQFRDSMAL